MFQTEARYFDGISAKAHDSKILLDPSGNIVLQLKNESRTFSRSNIRLAEHVRETPYQIIVETGGMIEVQHSARTAEFMAAVFPSQTSLSEVLERSFIRSTSISFLAILFSALILVYGVPFLIRIIFPFIPTSVKEHVAESTIESLDSFLLKASSVSAGRQKEYQHLASPLLNAALQDRPVNLLFRDTRMRMANAFALLPKTIICTDQLLNLLEPAEVQAVLAHEIGHLKLDHGTQQLVNQVFMQVLPSLALGSSGGGSTFVRFFTQMVLPNAYSRDQEREADAFGVLLLKELQLQPRALISALEKLEKFYQNGDEKKEIWMVDMFEHVASSHPDLEERRKNILSLAQ